MPINQEGISNTQHISIWTAPEVRYEKNSTVGGYLISFSWPYTHLSLYIYDDNEALTFIERIQTCLTEILKTILMPKQQT